jgi:hypothetical protein
MPGVLMPFGVSAAAGEQTRLSQGRPSDQLPDVCCLKSVLVGKDARASHGEPRDAWCPRCRSQAR